MNRKAVHRFIVNTEAVGLCSANVTRYVLASRQVHHGTPVITLTFADCLKIGTFQMDMCEYYYHYSLSLNFCFRNWTAT